MKCYLSMSSEDSDKTVHLQSLPQTHKEFRWIQAYKWVLIKKVGLSKIQGLLKNVLQL